MEEAIQIYLNNLYVSRGEVELLQLEHASKFPNLEDDEESYIEEENTEVAGGYSTESTSYAAFLSDLTWVESLYVKK